MFLRKIMSWVVAAACLCGCGEEKTERLVVATSLDNPPYAFYKNGEMVGLEVDLMHAIGEKLGKSVEIKDVSFDSIIGGLQANRYDFAIASVNPTPDREEKVDFSTPYHKTVTVLIVPLAANIKTISDLKDKTVGAQLGSTYEALVRTEWQKVVANLQMRSLSKIPEIIQDFKAGRIDAIVNGQTEAQGIIKAHSDLKMVPIAGTEAVYAVVFPKGALLRDKVNQMLSDFAKDGTLRKLEQKWLQAF